MFQDAPVRTERTGPVVGLALGSGAARGWAHLGVLRVLAREGIEPEVVCGCSVGAFVGAAFAAGDLARLTEWVEGLKWPDVVSMLDVSFRGGLIKGRKLIEFFERNFVDRDFTELARPFACVATELQSGREVWLRTGSVAHAVRASIALPGLLTPQIHDGRILVDGGLVNPVPVSLCRAMGADIVIAVDLGSDLVGRAWRPAADEGADETFGWSDRLLARLGLTGNGGGRGAEVSDVPSMLTVMTSSINIMQARIARSRLAGEPADVLISPRLGHLGPMDFHRAREAMTEGEAAATHMLPALRHALNRG